MEFSDLRMGKTKKKRQSASARVDPVGLGETGDNLEMNGEPTETEIIANIMSQLQSGNPEDKVCGCQSLGNLTSLEIIRGVIVDQKLVRIAGPLLLDSDQMVRLAAAGALRNLSATDPDTAEEIVKQDVMTPVLEFFNQLTSRQTDTLTDQEYNILTEAVN
ncbi:HEAT repeat-containing protein 3 [Eurytemora carolleeae]|uniref:HEAT repeat-containing protein 3 n=1 Tax=Eurytemora carolleeae TaxID=1294199 RepID=UPI000C785FA4|nr:HEAT repeat-containing protein 3 [Eurytemora carolleeae]|eukprot:XP_023343660.1 HEAT repeat-containing protein 3-like [Eurytemora affinis]